MSRSSFLSRHVVGGATATTTRPELPYGQVMTEALEPAPLLCHPCLLRSQVQRAWTVFEGASLCMRCAVEQQTGNDDMLQHGLVADLYEQLRKLGHGDAY